MAQKLTTHKLLSVGYVYQNQSFGEIGSKLLLLNNDNILYRVGASAMLGQTNEKFTFIPKIQGDILFNFEKNVDIHHSYYFLTGAEFTSQYIAPKAGISLFGIVDFTAGYAFSINKKGLNGKILEGLNMGISLNIPTSIFVK